MLEQARKLLSCLGGWKCETILKLHEDSGPEYFFANKDDFLTGKSSRLFLQAEQIRDEDISRLCTMRTSLVVLACSDEPLVALESFEVQTKKNKIGFQKHSWFHFRNELLGIDTICDRYISRQKEYQDTEDAEFHYIQPSVVNQDDKKSENLFRFVDNFCVNKTGLINLLAEYGEGKSSFCLNWICERLSSLHNFQPIPLLFLLNECEAGSLEDFLVIRLKKDYQLALSFEEFLYLCNQGLFILLLDAFDQMHNDPQKKKIADDYRTVLQLANEKGRVILTCRAEYYRKYLSPLSSIAEDNSCRTYHLFLKGFAKPEIDDFLKKHTDLKNLLTDSSSNDLLEYIYQKPLILQIIKSSKKRFSELKNQKEQDKESIREFDIFNMVFQSWLDEHPFKGLLTVQQRKIACKEIALLARLHGMNRSFSFDVWADAFMEKHSIPENQAKSIVDDLKALPLLDRCKLNIDRLGFRFNIYLEFLFAYFILEEIRRYPAGKIYFLNEYLTWETRQLIAGQLDIDVHGDRISEIIGETAYKDFRDVRYQGTNCLNMTLDVLRHPGLNSHRKNEWHNMLLNHKYRKNVFWEADCRGADLTDLDFSHVDFTGADFSYARLQNTKMEFAVLTDAIFRDQGKLITTSFFFRSETGSQFLAGGTETGTLLIWGADLNAPLRTQLHHGHITSLAVTSDGAEVFTGSEDGSVCSIMTDNPEEQKFMSFDIRGICSLALSWDNRELFLGGQSGEIVVRNLRNKKIKTIHLGNKPKAWITSLCPDRTGKRLYAGNAQGHLFCIEHWSDKEKIKEVVHINQGINRLIQVDKDFLLVYTDNHELLFYIVNEKKQKKPLVSMKADAVCYSKASRQLFRLLGKSLSYCTVNHDGTMSRSIDMYCNKPGKTISSSDDGEFVAVGGNSLLLFKRGANGYRILDEKEMFMDCRGFIFDHAAHLNSERVGFFLSRGAALPSNEYLKTFVNLDKVGMDRNRRIFVCSTCGQERKWTDLALMGQSKLTCRHCINDKQ